MTHFPADGGTVLRDAGTTTGALLDILPTDRRLHVVTNVVGEHHGALALGPPSAVKAAANMVRAATVEATRNRMQRRMLSAFLLVVSVVGPARGEPR